MHFLTRFFLLIIMALGSAHAADVPNYIGVQTFRLTDDQDYNNAMRRADDAKVEVARSEQAQSQIGDQVRILEGQQRAILDKMTTLQRDVEALKVSKQNLNTKLEALKQTPDVNAEAITATQTEIAAVDQSILEKNQQAGALKLESAPVNVRLDQVRNDFNIAARRTEDARQRMQMAARQREDYRNDLFAQIIKINAEGARLGQNDGSTDGADLSFRLGNDKGNSDGINDGTAQGTRDGQDRFYQRGAAQGERDGSARARIDGLRDGTNEGTVNGNKSAGAREGRAAGLKRGDGSNAALVGSDQGKKAGLERAVSTGATNGRATGESETTRKLESGELKSIEIGGAFAGSFQRQSPDYPGDFNGSNFRPNFNHNRDILRKAYADGYLYNYRQFTRYEFLRRVDTDYNQRYDQSYRVSYDSAVNREYPAQYDQGRRTADANAYNRDYPLVKADAYRAAFDQLNGNPNRASGEFKSSYASSEAMAYNERFEEIRSANFDRVEDSTFTANIGTQTEIYRLRRTTEVTNIYNNNAILQFVSSDMYDGGIKGVAALDSVFQPGETTNHNVVLRNFGFKDATNVSVVLSNGAVAKIPSIAARSIVTIKSAAQGSVTAALNTVYNSSLRVVSPLATNDAVEGRYFDKLTGGILKDADQKAIRVQYPLALTGLSLESQLLKGVKNKLKVTLTNNSKRAYNGELKIKLLANSQNGIITKEFNALSTLSGSVSLSDAEILVDAEQDAYRDLSISATVEQNGVLIGVLSQDLATMAKAKFLDKGRVPVLVANTDTNLNAFLDALNTLGGSEKVSILDLSLASLNAQSLADGLSQKTLLIADDSTGSAIKSLNAFIAKSKSSAFIFIDDNANGLTNALTLASLKDAPKLLLGKRTIAFSNPHRAVGVLKTSAFMQSSSRTFMNDLGVAQTLTLSAPEHLADLKLKLSADNFTTPNESMKLYSLKALAEVLCLNKAYDESGGIFSRDTKWAKLIKEDATLFHNQLKAASSGDVVVSKIPMILAAIAMKETLSSAMSRADGISNKMMPKITNATNDVLGSMEDSFKKNLKKDFKAVYTKAYDNSKVHNPFVIPDAEEF